MTIDEIKEYILDVPDFPKPGIMFKDIMPLLENGVVRDKVLELLVSDASISVPISASLNAIA